MIEPVSQCFFWSGSTARLTDRQLFYLEETLKVNFIFKRSVGDIMVIETDGNAQKFAFQFAKKSEL